MPFLISRSLTRGYAMRNSLALACTLLCFAVARPSHAIEAWADPSLKVVQGLELWLDASRLVKAAQVHGTSLADKQQVETWFDASGKQRDLRKSVSIFQPLLETHLVPSRPDEAVLRFDGADDRL